MKQADSQIIALLQQIKAAQAGGYSLQASAAFFSPGDGQAYFFGGFPQAAITTTAGIRRLYIPQAGVITKVFVFFNVATTLGTSEPSLLYVRLNDTTDTLVTSTLILDAVTVARNNTALSIPVAAGDYIEMKLSCPAWVTNPTDVRPSAIIFIKTN